MLRPKNRHAGSPADLTRAGTLTVVLAFMTLALAACGGGPKSDGLAEFPRGPDVPIIIPPGKPIVIGVSTALTGPVGPRGNEYRDAVIVGVEDWKRRNGELIAGHEVAIRAEDDGCGVAEVATEAAQRLAKTPGLVGVVGPQCSGGALASLPIFNAAGIVAISGSATRTDITTGQAANGYFFRTAYRNDLEGILIGAFVAGTLKPAQWYLIDDGSAFGTDLAAAAETYGRNAGVLPVRASLKPGDVDFGELTRRIAADQPGFVGFAGFNPEAALLLRQLRDAGYKGPFGAADGSASQAQFVDPLGTTADETLFSGCGFALPPDLAGAFTELHGDPPSATFTAQYVDAVQILLDAVRTVAVSQADGSVTIEPARLRDAVRGTVHAGGLTGPIAFDQRGDRLPDPTSNIDELLSRVRVIQDPTVFLSLGLITCQVQDGKIVPLSGPGAASPVGVPGGR